VGWERKFFLVCGTSDKENIPKENMSTRDAWRCLFQINPRMETPYFHAIINDEKKEAEMQQAREKQALLALLQNRSLRPRAKFDELIDYPYLMAEGKDEDLKRYIHFLHEYAPLACPEAKNYYDEKQAEICASAIMDLPRSQFNLLPPSSAFRSQADTRFVPAGNWSGFDWTFFPERLSQAPAEVQQHYWGETRGRLPQNTQQERDEIRKCTGDFSGALVGLKVAKQAEERKSARRTEHIPKELWSHVKSFLKPQVLASAPSYPPGSVGESIGSHSFNSFRVM
jgi:hypothetical protein